MAEFNNYTGKAQSFDSFSGVELKAYLKITTKYDEYGQTKEYKLVPLGELTQIVATTQYENVPNIYIGFSRPSSISTGTSIVSGTLMYSVLDKGFLKELTDVFKEAGFKRTYLSMENDKDAPKFGYDDIRYINEFPMIDMVILGVKNNDPDKKIQLEIKGMKLSSGHSGIGITQLAVNEQYSFIAKKLYGFRPVEGVGEVKDGEENLQDSYFDIG